MTEIEGALIAGRPPRYVQLATAAAPEGQKSLDRWHNLARRRPTDSASSKSWLTCERATSREHHDGRKN